MLVLENTVSLGRFVQMSAMIIIIVDHVQVEMALLFRRFLIVVAVFSLTTFRSAAKQYDGLVEVRELPLSRVSTTRQLFPFIEHDFKNTSYFRTSHVEIGIKIAFESVVC